MIKPTIIKQKITKSNEFAFKELIYTYCRVILSLAAKLNVVNFLHCR